MKRKWKILLFATALLFSFSFVILGSAHATVQQTDIVSFWPLDEEAPPDPTSYADVVGGQNGSPDALPTPEPLGQVNGAQSFDGSDDGILVLDSDLNKKRYFGEDWLFNFPRSIAFDGSDNMYVSNTHGDVAIFVFDESFLLD